jgi:hypothetical protein
VTTNITAMLGDIRRGELLREAAAERLPRQARPVRVAALLRAIGGCASRSWAAPRGMWRSDTSRSGTAPPSCVPPGPSAAGGRWGRLMWRLVQHVGAI